MPAGDSTRRPSKAGSWPSVALVVREHQGRAFYEAKFRHDGRQVMRRIGPAWLDRSPDGDWRPRRGRVRDGFYDERRAHVRAAELMRAYVVEADDRERSERDRLARGVTFRDLAAGYLRWLEDVKGARPSTLRQHRSDLAEPDTPFKRGQGATSGRIMRALGGRPAKEISTHDVEALLQTVADSGVTPRTVNRVRAVVSAVFNYGRRAHGLTHNPAAGADKRRERQPGPLAYYSVEQVEALARALADGLHRPDPGLRGAFERWEDARDGEAVRVAAYTGIRLGELLALRWRDIDWQGSALTVSRALSAGVEGPPKSGHVRRVPLADPAAAALERLSRREHYVGPDELVFCSVLGRHLDGSALRRRFKRARDAAGLEPLRWHDLRHCFGSLLVAGGVDLQSVRDAMGHSDLTVTARYLHARAATERAGHFTQALRASAGAELIEEVRDGS